MNLKVSLPVPPVRLAKPAKVTVAHGTGVDSGHSPGTVRIRADQGVRGVRAIDRLDVGPGAADGGRGLGGQIDRYPGLPYCEKSRVLVGALPLTFPAREALG